MSRIASHTSDGRRVAFGLDHACGWFLQVEAQDPVTKEWEITVDLDGYLSRPRLSRGLLLEKLESLLPESERERLHHCISYIALDMDPALGLPE